MMTSGPSIPALPGLALAALLLLSPACPVTALSSFAACIDHPEGSDKGPCLVTSGPSIPALPGLVLARVLEACEVLRLPVVLRPPRAVERAGWKEAFLTNW